MIVLDTHIWVWWVHAAPELKPWMHKAIVHHESDGIGISVISCWEIARLVADSRLDLHRPPAEWFAAALSYPGVQLIDLSPDISIEANILPGAFHKDPADRIIVATARLLDCELLTADSRILAYNEVKLASSAKSF